MKRGERAYRIPLHCRYWWNVTVSASRGERKSALWSERGRPWTWKTKDRRFRWPETRTYSDEENKGQNEKGSKDWSFSKKTSKYGGGKEYNDMCYLFPILNLLNMHHPTLLCSVGHQVFSSRHESKGLYHPVVSHFFS